MQNILFVLLIHFIILKKTFFVGFTTTPVNNSQNYQWTPAGGAYNWNKNPGLILSVIIHMIWGNVVSFPLSSGCALCAPSCLCQIVLWWHLCNLQCLPVVCFWFFVPGFMFLLCVHEYLFELYLWFALFTLGLYFLVVFLFVTLYLGIFAICNIGLFFSFSCQSSHFP